MSSGYSHRLLRAAATLDRHPGAATLLCSAAPRPGTHSAATALIPRCSASQRLRRVLPGQLFAAGRDSAPRGCRDAARAAIRAGALADSTEAAANAVLWLERCAAAVVGCSGGGGPAASTTGAWEAVAKGCLRPGDVVAAAPSLGLLGAHASIPGDVPPQAVLLVTTASRYGVAAVALHEAQPMHRDLRRSVTAAVGAADAKAVLRLPLLCGGDIYAPPQLLATGAAASSIRAAAGGHSDGNDCVVAPLAELVSEAAAAGRLGALRRALKAPGAALVVNESLLDPMTLHGLHAAGHVLLLRPTGPLSFGPGAWAAAVATQAEHRPWAAMPPLPNVGADAVLTADPAIFAADDDHRSEEHPEGHLEHVAALVDSEASPRAA